MSKIKQAKILQDTPILKYEICERANNHGNCLLELSENHIILRFFWQANSDPEYRRNFIGFISLIGILSEHYEVELADMYDYIIEALDRNFVDILKSQSNIIDNLKERIKILDASNCTISNELVCLSSMNIHTTKSMELLREFGRSVIKQSEFKEKVQRLNNHAILTSLGVDSELIVKVERMLQIEKW